MSPKNGRKRRRRLRTIEVRHEDFGDYFGHDASLAYFLHGKLVAFDEAERFTRRKRQFGVSGQHIESFLSDCGVEFRNVDVVAICSTQGWKVRNCDCITMTVGFPFANSLPPSNLLTYE